MNTKHSQKEQKLKSIQTDSERVNSQLTIRRNKWLRAMKYKCKCRVRWFHSKGAFLVLFWSFSVGMVLWASFKFFFGHLSLLKSVYYGLIALVPITGILSAPVFGWLADAKLGNYRVLRVGLVLMFLATVINCVCLSIGSVVSDFVLHSMISINSIGLIMGLCAYYTTALEFGLDQILDASTPHITSFITCYLFSSALGCFVSEIVYHAIFCCSDKSLHAIFCCSDESLRLNYAQIWSLGLVFCMSIVLISDLILTPKWLTVEFKLNQSLKTIYQVLKFAAKHKAPLNRSALTYWEEDIPSRLDLGKSKYGGPFSTEQVEDVKTILRLMLLSLSLWAIVFCIGFRPSIPKIPPEIPPSFNSSIPILADYCERTWLVLFTFNKLWCIIITTLVWELVVYPLARHKLPTILQRIGMVSFTLTALSLVCLILALVNYLQGESITIDWVSTILHWAVTGGLLQIFLTATFELVCAQSPSNMRGVFTGYLTILLVINIGLSRLISGILKDYTKHNSVIALSVKTLLSFMAFILHCVLAHRYKRRVRDEDYSAQRVVEEVYHRYMTRYQNM